MQRPGWRRTGNEWRVTLLAVLVLAVAIVPVGMGPAHAHPRAEGEAEEGEFDDVAFEESEFDDVAFESTPVDQLVALPGSCPTAAPIEPGNAIDCFFDILPGVDNEALAFADALLDGTSSRCHVEAGVNGWDRLVCAELARNRFVPGEVAVGLRIEGATVDAAATVATEWASDAPFALFGYGLNENVVFEGRPLRWSAVKYEELEGLFLNVRQRWSSEIVETISVDLGEAFESVDGAVVPDLPVGRYRAWPCVGASTDTCEEQPGGLAFQVIDGEPLELVPGHNRRTAERINVLFVASGLRQFVGDAPSNQLPELARTMLTVGGPRGVDFNDQLVGEDELASSLLWGPMAIEPLASNLDRFNFWYLADEIADEESVLFGGFDPTGDEGFGLPNLQITALYNNGSDVVSDARWTSFVTVEPDTVPLRGQIRFGDARVWIPAYSPLSGATTLAHEWGHGLFSLRDEYYGFDDRGIDVGFPNCAPDVETAELWWGDVIGQVDPFVDEVIATRQERLEFSEFLEDDLAELTMVEITAGGCYSDFGSTEVYRPSVDSLMNSEVPVFGVINRRRVQEVLNRFSGRGPMGSLDDLTISCEGLAGFVNCRGELLTHLNKPLSIVAINSIPCEFGSARPLPGGTRAPVPVTCSTTGEPSAPVVLSFKSESLTLDVVDANVPPPSPVPERVFAERAERLEERALQEAGASEAEGQDDSTGTGTGRTVVIGVLLCVAAIALGFVERRRRLNESSD